MKTEICGNKGFRISWADDNLGFGEIAFYKDNGKLKLDTENMGKDFVKKVLNNLVDNTEIEE
jgi:hypothetical protein